MVEESRVAGQPFGVNQNRSIRDAILAVSTDKDARQTWREKHGGYDFWVIGKSYADYLIEARNESGGRGFLFDPRVAVTRLVFRSKTERLQVGGSLRAFFAGELTHAERTALFLAVDSIEGLIGAQEILVRRLMARHLGDFLHDDDLQSFVLSVAFRDADRTTREQCLRSMVSVGPLLLHGTLEDVAKAIDQRRANHEMPIREGTPEENLLERLSKLCKDG